MNSYTVNGSSLKEQLCTWFDHHRRISRIITWALQFGPVLSLLGEAWYLLAHATSNNIGWGLPSVMGALVLAMFLVIGGVFTHVKDAERKDNWKYYADPASSGCVYLKQSLLGQYREMWRGIRFTWPLFALMGLAYGLITIFHL